MKKRDIPKPKYDFGESVLFFIPGDGNYAPRREIGRIELIQIIMTMNGSSIRYGFENKPDTHEESIIVKKV